MNSRFPSPPPGKTGWPWDFVPKQIKINSEVPRVTIVTPSYNHADYLEETIRSVLLQDYPNLEYFVIDGGSTDKSVEIIKKYEPWLAGWASEPDSGQSNAINKGFAQATGEWLGWINSDDCYAPYALYNLICTAQANQSDFVYGNSIQFGHSNYPMIKKQGPSTFDIDVIRLIDVLDQPSTLWRQDVFFECGPLSESLHYAFDWDFFIKCAEKCKSAFSNSIISVYRLHTVNKTLVGGNRRFEELIEISMRNQLPSIRKKFIELLPLIQRLRELKSVRETHKGIPKFLARIILRLFREHGLLRLFGLPIELWTVIGITDHSIKKYATIRYASTQAHTVSGALDCFQAEVFIPNNFDIPS